MSNLAEAAKALTAKQAGSSPVLVMNPVLQGQSATINPVVKTGLNPAQQNNQDIMYRIKELRTAKGWTQRDLAREAGMSQGTITRAERHMQISYWCLIRIANALGRNLIIQ